MDKLLRAFTVQKLRSELSKKNLDTSGLKATLIIRLSDYLMENDIPIPEYVAKNLESDEESPEMPAPPEKIEYKDEARSSQLNTPGSGNYMYFDPNILSLPALHINSFKGDPEEYPRFMAQINEMILKTNINDFQKLSRIVQLLEGNAKDSVKYLEGMDGGLQEALKILKDRYGQTYQIVFSIIENIVNQKSIQEHDKCNLRKFSDKLRCAFYTIKQMDQLNEVNTSYMVKIVSKLPVSLQIRWRDFAAKMRPRSPSFEELVNFIECRSNAINEPIYGNINTQKSDYKVHANNTFVSKPVYNEFIRVCVMCKGNHKLIHCELFLKLSVNDRKLIVTKNNLCHNCLGKNHQVKDCRSKLNCLKHGCGRPHNTLIHDECSIPTYKSNCCSVDTNVVSNSVGVNESAFLQVVPIRIFSKNNKFSEEVFALLDTASEASFVSESLSKRLNLEEAQSSNIKVKTLTGSNVVQTKSTNFTISAIDSSFDILINNAFVMKHLNMKLDKLPINNNFSKYTHLSDIHLPKTKANTVEIIIGSNVPRVFVSSEYRIGRTDEPIGIKTPLGWSIFGSSVKSNSFNSFCTTYEPIQTIDDAQQVLFNQIISETDFDCGKVSGKKESMHDREILLMLDNTVKIEDNGQFVIPMLWNSQKDDLVNNLNQVITRATYLKKRLLQNENILQRYVATMENYFSEGYARVVPADEISNSKWFLPHHGIINDKKPEKIRIVFDAAAKFHGLSLNDCLYQGPDLLNSITGVLTRFRQGETAIKGDIESMFHRILLTKCDRCYVRFLWWKNGFDKDLVVCEMTVHIFGAKCSPAVANYALQRSSETISNSLKQNLAIEKSIKRNFYVDDYLKSGKFKEMLDLTINIRETLLKRGFKLTKFQSNNSDFRLMLKDNLEITKNNIQRTLGIEWDINKDCFRFTAPVIETKLTKRGILSSSSLIFDPLGFLSPILITPKLILQKLWQDKYDWDDPIDVKQAQLWNKWCNSLKNIENIFIPRCLSNSNVISFELHAFSDASSIAYGASVYLRSLYSDNTVKVTIVAGKARVAPLKYVSIPRLELQAAVLSSTLINDVKNNLEYEIMNTYLWTDSTTTLKYISNKHLKLSTFIANRVSKIHDLTGECFWRYCPTKLNPADDASRGISPELFMSDSRWLSGPSFLTLSENCWPQNIDIPVNSSTDIINLNVTITNETKFGLEKIIHYFSDYNKLITCVSWFLRYKSFLKRNINVATGSLTLDELKLSESTLISYIQVKHLSSDIEKLKISKQISKSSKLLKLSPFLDDKMFLRVGGRLKNSCLNFEQKHPIILPKTSYFTKLLCTHFHIKNLHSSCEHTIASLRKTFWVLGVKKIISNIIFNCVKCKRYNARRCGQFMGELPASRTECYEPPFTKVGIDFFGPFEVSLLRRKFKYWGVIFICFSTKAIHLELCPGLSTDEFLDTFIQFKCRRGRVKEIWTDQGTNFVAAEKEFKGVFKSWIDDNLVDKCRLHNVKWVFNPPSSSHMGGLWERGIKSVRRCLRVLTNGQIFNLHKLRTFITIVESVLNDRPIVAVSDDANDLECLTPSHFLLQQSFSAHKYETSCSSRKRWQQIQELTDRFWKRWVNEYLPTLQSRQKWTQARDNIKINDIVLIINENIHRGNWPLGRVVEIFPDSDSNVRSVSLKTKNGILYRPIHKLCLLEASI